MAEVAADSTAVVAEAGSAAAALAAADIPVSAVADGRMAGRIVAADSRRAPLAGPRIEARWALDRLQARDRVRALVQAWPAEVSAARGDRREFAMPSRTASGIRLEAPAA